MKHNQDSREKVHFDLASPYLPRGDQPRAIEQVTSQFENGRKFQTLLGVTGSGKTFSVAHIIKNLGRPTLVLAPNKTLAAQLYGEFREFFPQNAVEYFVSYYDFYRPEAYVPSSDTYIEKDASINEEIDKLRHSTTRSLIERRDVIVVASVSCIYGIGSPDDYKENSVTLSEGDTLDRDILLKNLVSMQYGRNDIDFFRGTFRVRGDIVEIFPAYEDSDVIRVEFFGDTIDGLNLVDPLRGKVIRPLNRITIFPSSHYVVAEGRLKSAIHNIRSELRERLVELEQKGKVVERARLEQRTLLDLEMMEEMGYCSGIENYSRHLTGKKAGEPPPTLIDFFNKDFLMVVDESHITIPQAGAMYKGDRSRKETLVNFGFRLPSALDNRPLNFMEFEERMDQVLFVSATPGPYELKTCRGEIVEQIIRPTGLVDPIVELRDAQNQVDDLLMEIKKVVKLGYRILITTLTKRLAEELSVYYGGIGIKIRYLHSDINTIERLEILQDLRIGNFDVLVGINLLREGLDLPEVALVAILDADKEGFLRSTQSLIQTIGRAARNVHGKVLLYGYKKTPNIERAMAETLRRRKIQEKYNLDHDIVPKTVDKKILGGVIEVLQREREKQKGKRKSKSIKDMGLISSQELEKKIMSLKEEMKKAAKALEFEKAAKLRDEIKELRELNLLM